MQDTKHEYTRSFSPKLVTKKFPFRVAVDNTTIVSPYAGLSFGIDVSRYQPYIEYEKLSGIIDFAICKCSEGTDWKDPSFAAHVDGFVTKTKIPVIAYHYFRKDWYVEYGMNWYDRIKPEDDRQLQNLLYCIKNKNIHGIFVDSEETNDPVWSVSALSHFMLRLDKALSEHPYLGERFNEGKFFFGVYTGEWHWNMAKNQYSFLARIASNGNPYHLHIAKYPYASGVVTTTWEEFKQKYLPAQTTIPTLSAKDWNFWQFTGDKFILPYVYGSTAKSPTALDLNFYKGTKEMLYEKIGFSGGVVTPPPTQPETPPVSGLDEVVKLHTLQIEAINTKLKTISDVLKG